LLVADPLRFVGAPHGPPLWLFHTLMPLAHLISFSVLAVLTLAARWPLPRWLIATLLVTYAGATEIVQSCLPPRTAEWTDWFQDLGGILIGAALCWGVAAAVSWLFRRSNDLERQLLPVPSSDDEMLRNVMSRSSQTDESWWS
jgi:hypothetical protein